MGAPSVEDEWKQAAAGGRRKALGRYAIAGVVLLAMTGLSAFFFLGEQVFYAFMSLVFGVVFAIAAASGTLVNTVRSLLGMRPR